MFDWILSRKLGRIAKTASPDRTFVRGLELKLKARMPHRASRSLLWKSAVGSLTGITLLLSGTGVYAYTSDDVTSDSALYPVRTGIEQVEQSIAVFPNVKAAVALHLLKRRIKEQQILIKRQRAITQEQETRFFQTVERAIEAGDALEAVAQGKLDTAVVELEGQYPTVTTSSERTVEQLHRIEQRINQLAPARRAVYASILERRLQLRQEIRERIRTRTTR
ncbi:MAG: DUF5667 domain-containing protein [Patescibacteria group bacterium]